MVIEIVQSYPRISILVASLGVSFFISLINFLVLDKNKIKEMKERQKKINEEMKLHKNNPAKVMELNKELMSHVGENFKHSMKPMLITLIPILIIFSFIKGIFDETTISGSWFWWYLGGAIVSSIFFRKLFKLP